MDAVNAWLPANDGNPCVVIPTGGGKTPTMAWLIQQWLQLWPGTRVLVLAHIRELLTQGVHKMQQIWPDAPIGVYSAGLKSRDMHQPITYAGIQSVRQLGCEFDPFDVIFVDESHRIPVADEGTYRQFLAATALANPARRVVGWTATPYRLDGGPICGPGKLLTEIIYEANVRDLIEQGYLSQLKTKGADTAIDASSVSIRKGEFVTSQLESLVFGKVPAAIAEAMSMLHGRRAVMFFCVSIAHAHEVSAELFRYGFIAPVISKDTPAAERDRILADFKAGRIRGVCNVNVLTEGFDAEIVDGIVMLRPTASPGLYYQQIGRGLRTFLGKLNCLVLDFAGNIARHGPIDAIRTVRGDKFSIGGGVAPMKACPSCKEMIYASLLVCPECQHEFPAPEIKHETTAASTPILSTNEPWRSDVSDVLVFKHDRPGKTPSLRVMYVCGFEKHTEYICLEHVGYPQTKAHAWWRRRFGDPVPTTVDAALNEMFLGHRLKSMTTAVTVRQVGKYTEVVNVSLKDEHKAISA